VQQAHDGKLYVVNYGTKDDPCYYESNESTISIIKYPRITMHMQWHDTYFSYTSVKTYK